MGREPALSKRLKRPPPLLAALARSQRSGFATSELSGTLSHCSLTQHLEIASTRTFDIAEPSQVQAFWFAEPETRPRVVPAQDRVEAIRFSVLHAKRSDRSRVEPLQFLLLMIARWMTRDHQRVTEYLLAENAVLREQFRGRRIIYTDAQRRRRSLSRRTTASVARQQAHRANERQRRQQRPC